MRGKRVSVAPRRTKADLVVVAARYAGDGPDRRLQFVQVYEHHGVVWSDIKLYRRDQLVEALKAGKRVVAGRPGELATDFQFEAPIELIGSNGLERLRGGADLSSVGDDLGVPLL